MAAGQGRLDVARVRGLFPALADDEVAPASGPAEADPVLPTGSRGAA